MRKLQEPYVWLFSAHQFIEYIWRKLRTFFDYTPLCQYIRRCRPSGLTLGYLLMDYIEKNDGVMLSESWEEKRQD